jgi:hypothetical protein
MVFSGEIVRLAAVEQGFREVRRQVQPLEPEVAGFERRREVGVLLHRGGRS